MPTWLFLLISVPSVSAFIGWITNWQAVKMIFWPERRVGWGRLSWQGIIFHHADKFASNLGHLAENHLMSGREAVAKLNLGAIETLIARSLERKAPDLVAQAAELIRPGAWASVAEPMRAMVVAQVQTKSQSIARELAAELAPAVASELNIDEVVRAQLSGDNVRRLSRLTHQIGYQEFRFIEWSGAVFGLVIGLAQLLVWNAMQIWWLMPIFGIGVGLVTNWLALQMIFRPHERTRYLGVPYQGLFPKRQPEISRDYGRTTASEVLTPSTLIDSLLLAPRRQRLEKLLIDGVGERIDREWDSARAMVPLSVSDDVLTEIKALILAQLFSTAAEQRPAIEALLSESLDIQATVETRLAAMSKPEFERLLRGVFQEDEWTLILVGGALGGLVGVIQAVLVLST
jgi:uncharacterized membrane protein YheB (UPF0754 family)